MLRLKNLTWTMAIASMGLLTAGTAVHAQQYPSQQPNAQPSGRYESSGQANRSTQKEYNSASQAVPPRKFLKQAAQDDLAEVKLGELAQRKGTTSTVRDFGKRMQTDHMKNADQLKTVAQQQGVTLPSAVNAKQEATYDKLSKLSGWKFDEMYAKDMVKDHTKAVREFKHEARSSKNEGVKMYASNSVPVLETHLRLAHHMMNSLNSNGSSSQSGSY